MEILLCWTVGVLFAISIYLLLSRHLLSALFGIVLSSGAANLMIFTLGRLTHTKPAFIDKTSYHHLANALPQALILTAIVISFSILAYTLVLITIVWQQSDTMDIDALDNDKSL